MTYKKKATVVQGPYVVGRAIDYKLFMSRNPRCHDTPDEALAEAGRLHALHDNQFMVFGVIGKSRPSSTTVFRRKAKKTSQMRGTMAEVLDSLVLGVQHDDA